MSELESGLRVQAGYIQIQRDMPLLIAYTLIDLIGICDINILVSSDSKTSKYPAFYQGLFII
jgi:hypothetical protein